MQCQASGLRVHVLGRSTARLSWGGDAPGLCVQALVCCSAVDEEGVQRAHAAFSLAVGSWWEWDGRVTGKAGLRRSGVPKPKPSTLWHLAMPPACARCMGCDCMSAETEVDFLLGPDQDLHRMPCLAGWPSTLDLNPKHPCFVRCWLPDAIILKKAPPPEPTVDASTITCILPGTRAICLCNQ